MPTAIEKWNRNIENIRSEHPFGPYEIKRDLDGRPHCDDGPAYISPTTLTWFDKGRRHGASIDKWGSKTYYFKDVLVPSYFFENPERLTFDKVLAFVNAEVRRVAMELYGFDRMIEEKRFNILDENERGEMLLKNKDLCLAAVWNATAEPDGTYKRYFLQVPPEMERLRQAVAWTFEMEEEEYCPSVET